MTCIRTHPRMAHLPSEETIPWELELAPCITVLIRVNLTCKLELVPWPRGAAADGGDDAREVVNVECLERRQGDNIVDGRWSKT